jgi:SAM-dependent methyltransferase
MKDSKIYANPREMNNIEECNFYHTVDIPGYGTIEGQWDLREHINEYLGNVDFKGKRVLEIGTAEGQLCFEMEKRGAEVVGLDISRDIDWDVVPYAQYDYQVEIERRKYFTERLNKGYWFSHKIFNSKAKVVCSSVYDLPLELGAVDIVTFGAVLLHLHDPFGAMQRGLQLARETTIVTDALITDFQGKPYMEFRPDFKNQLPKETWWNLSPEIIIRMIGVLGFEETNTIFHQQKYKGFGEKKWEERKCFTVVGRRTKGTAIY